MVNLSWICCAWRVCQLPTLVWNSEAESRTTSAGVVDGSKERVSLLYTRGICVIVVKARKAYL